MSAKLHYISEFTKRASDGFTQWTPLKAANEAQFVPEDKQTAARQAIETLINDHGNGAAVYTDFGAGSETLLREVLTQQPDMKVIFVDSGDLPPENHARARDLCRELQPNLKLYLPGISDESLNVRFGAGADPKSRSQQTLIEPLSRAIEEEGVTALIALETPGDIKAHNPFAGWSAEELSGPVSRDDLEQKPQVLAFVPKIA